MRILLADCRIRVRFVGLVLFGALMLTAGAVPRHALAQPVPAASRHSVASNPATDPRDSETPKSEEEQENAFLNAPVVHKIAHAFNLSEPEARTIFLILNFVIIFLAIAIPLARMMPKIFHKRTQTLRHQLDVARKASDEARQRMGAVEAKLAGLDREIAAFRTQVEQESLEDEQRIKASLKDETERILASAELEINAAASHARRTLRSFAADLAVEQASRQFTLTPETDRALIGEFLGQVTAQNGRGEDVAALAGKGGAK